MTKKKNETVDVVYSGEVTTRLTGFGEVVTGQVVPVSPKIAPGLVKDRFWNYVTTNEVTPKEVKKKDDDGKPPKKKKGDE